MNKIYYLYIMNETLDNESINRPGSPMEPPPPSDLDNYLTFPVLVWLFHKLLLLKRNKKMHVR